MVPAVDLSNWNSPYDLYIFNWPEISGGWQKMQREGLAGGALGAGIFGGDDVLGIGQDDAPAAPAQVCDFTEGPLVEQVQNALGVPATGVWDEATCAAWQDAYGQAPTTESLAAALSAPCADIVVPECRSQRGMATGVLLGLGVLAVAGFVIAGRKRR